MHFAPPDDVRWHRPHLRPRVDDRADGSSRPSKIPQLARFEQVDCSLDRPIKKGGAEALLHTADDVVIAPTNRYEFGRVPMAADGSAPMSLCAVIGTKLLNSVSGVAQSL